MRSEIDRAIEYANALRSRSVPPELRGPPRPGVDYSLVSTDEGKRNLERVNEYYDRIVACLQGSADIVDFHADSPTTISVLWDDKRESHHVTIELSLYGPLATVFVYGPVPEPVLQHVHSCLDAAGLIRLMESELRELEDRGEYLNLFE